MVRRGPGEFVSGGAEPSPVGGFSDPRFLNEILPFFFLLLEAFFAALDEERLERFFM
jgi:hypothetical protein